MEEGFPSVSLIARYRPAALIFRKGKQSVELLAQWVEQAVFSERLRRLSRQLEEVRQIHPSHPVQYKIKSSNLSSSCQSRVHGILLTSPVFPQFYLRLTDTENRKELEKENNSLRYRDFSIGLREGNLPILANILIYLRLPSPPTF